MSYFTPLTGLLGGTSIGKSFRELRLTAVALPPTEKRHGGTAVLVVIPDPDITVARNNTTVSYPFELLLVSHMILSPLLYLLRTFCRHAAPDKWRRPWGKRAYGLDGAPPTQSCHRPNSILETYLIIIVLTDINVGDGSKLYSGSS